MCCSHIYVVGSRWTIMSSPAMTDQQIEKRRVSKEKFDSSRRWYSMTARQNRCRGWSGPWHRESEKQNEACIIWSKHVLISDCIIETRKVLISIPALFDSSNVLISMCDLENPWLQDMIDTGAGPAQGMGEHMCAVCVNTDNGQVLISIPALFDSARYS